MLMESGCNVFFNFASLRSNQTEHEKVQKEASVTSATEYYNYLQEYSPTMRNFCLRWHRGLKHISGHKRMDSHNSREWQGSLEFL